jgi:N-methylhydantoinase A
VQLARSGRVALNKLDAASLRARFGEVEADAERLLLDAGLDRGEIKLHRAMDMRYRGQGFEIEVALPDADDAGTLLDQLHRLFDAAYEAVFSLSYVDQDIEIINWKIEAVGPLPLAGRKLVYRGDIGKGSARKGTRTAYFPEAGGMTECAVYDRYRLRPGETVDGPAFVEEREATFVIGVGDRVSVDSHGNLLAEIAGAAS